MRRVVPANTQWPWQTLTSPGQTMQPQVAESSALRLRWVSVMCAALTVVSVTLQAHLQPEFAALLKTPVLLALELLVLLMSLGILAIQRFRLLSPLAILHVGLAFEVVVAAAISYSETALPIPVDRPFFGTTKLALWIGVAGVLIPTRPWIRFVTALVCASTWPASYSLNVYLGLVTPLPLSRLLMWIYLPYLMAFVSLALSRRLFRMESAVQHAREVGSYQLVAPIGAGGMGEVWRASHRMLARDAAIKIIRSDLLLLRPEHESSVMRKRFALEASTIATLQSPHTVYLYDFGISEDGSPYYVMELLDGLSLQVLIDKFGPQPAARVVHILRQACDSLEEAHRRGLVHRDIKPNNLFTCAVGLKYDFVKVLDFGLVKQTTRQTSLLLTEKGTTAGTPAYMAPEVAMGHGRIDGRVDIYSLGCVAYFLLTGELVFDRKTATAMAMAHVMAAPAPPSQRSELPIPPRLDEIVMSCLAKTPESRPQSAGKLARLLESIEGLPEWTQEDAAAWWQANLPPSCSYRAARQIVTSPRSVPSPHLPR